MALPRVIYVSFGKELGGEKYLIASTQPDDLDEGIIGVYELYESLHMRHKTQFRRPKSKQWFDK